MLFRGLPGCTDLTLIQMHSRYSGHGGSFSSYLKTINTPAPANSLIIYPAEHFVFDKTLDPRSLTLEDHQNKSYQIKLKLLELSPEEATQYLLTIKWLSCFN